MVTKGAVLSGLQKGQAIQSRVARYTSGFGTSIRYDPNDTRETGLRSEGVVRDGKMTGIMRINSFCTARQARHFDPRFRHA